MTLFQIMTSTTLNREYLHWFIYFIQISFISQHSAGWALQSTTRCDPLGPINHGELVFAWLLCSQVLSTLKDHRDIRGGVKSSCPMAPASSLGVSRVEFRGSFSFLCKWFQQTLNALGICASPIAVGICLCIFIKHWSVLVTPGVCVYASCAGK